MNQVFEHLKWTNTKTSKTHEIVEKFEGSQLDGIEYVPLFTYFENE
jgi:isoleucyl-tRNA synthetase